MRLLWCEVHHCGNVPPEGFYQNPEVCLFESEFGPDGDPCRMVVMRLTPDRFLVATVNMGGIAHWMIPVSALDEETPLMGGNLKPRVPGTVAMEDLDDEETP